MRSKILFVICEYVVSGSRRRNLLVPYGRSRTYYIVLVQVRSKSTQTPQDYRTKVTVLNNRILSVQTHHNFARSVMQYTYYNIDE